MSPSYGTDALELKGRRLLLVATVDRFGMAEAFARAGCDMVVEI